MKGKKEKAKITTIRESCRLPDTLNSNLSFVASFGDRTLTNVHAAIYFWLR